MKEYVLLHNCPNCGGTLTDDGFCEFCKTKIRYANEMTLEDSDYFSGNEVEILIKRKVGDTTYVLPFVGYLSEIHREISEPHYIEYDGNRIPFKCGSDRMKLTFDGHALHTKELKVQTL